MATQYYIRNNVIVLIVLIEYVDSSFSSNLIMLMDSTKHNSCRKKHTYSILQYIQYLNMLFNYEKEIINLLVMLKYLSIQ